MIKIYSAIVVAIYSINSFACDTVENSDSHILYNDSKTLYDFSGEKILSKIDTYVKYQPNIVDIERKKYPYPRTNISSTITHAKYDYVKDGHYKLYVQPTHFINLFTTGVASCVAIIIHNPTTKTTGLMHYDFSNQKMIEWDDFLTKPIEHGENPSDFKVSLITEYYSPHLPYIFEKLNSYKYSVSDMALNHVVIKRKKNGIQVKNYYFVDDINFDFESYNNQIGINVAVSMNTGKVIATHDPIKYEKSSIISNNNALYTNMK